MSVSNPLSADREPKAMEEKHYEPDPPANFDPPASMAADMEECCGGHCGCHDNIPPSLVKKVKEMSPIEAGFRAAYEEIAKQAESAMIRKMTPEEIAERDAKLAAEANGLQTIKLPNADHDWCMPDCGQHETMVVSDPMTEEEKAAVAERIAQVKGEMPTVEAPAPYVPQPFYDRKGRRQNDIQHNKMFTPLKNELKGLTRNSPCPCGSGKKFKKCCWDTVQGI